MLIKITNKCGAGCSHCMEGSTPQGKHMSEETFLKALSMTRRVEAKAHLAGCPPMILLSGGECTEHPDIVSFIETTYKEGFKPFLITNGMWLSNVELRDSILRKEWRDLLIQVTHDARFYPLAPPVRVDDPRIFYVETLTALLPLGRASTRKGIADRGVPLKKAPSSFNLRSLTRAMKSIEDAVAHLRVRAATGLAGHCIPSICDNGDVMAGETRNCFKIGTVDSPNEELTKALVSMRCNNCGLVDNLTMEQKRAINESTLFGANE